MKYILYHFFFLMIRRPPRSTQSRSSAASDVYKRQELEKCFPQDEIFPMDESGPSHLLGDIHKKLSRLQQISEAMVKLVEGDGSSEHEAEPAAECADGLRRSSASMILEAAKEELVGDSKSTLRERVVEGLGHVRAELLSLQRVHSEALDGKFEAMLAERLQETQEHHQAELDERERRICSLQHRLDTKAVSYTHLRAHETVLDLVCRLLLEKKNHSDTVTTQRSLHSP
eukprot:TRINITY_DN4351_c0_g1_i1.p1 TRINITY_DN4351_c0_g1~~TRINITY_DN4351_c0_g1_i1.p1  ORF type:complete len:229 (+),score=99.44 TRINITY_DN4351_c0_g1_i1:83-769(+)